VIGQLNTRGQFRGGNHLGLKRRADQHASVLERRRFAMKQQDPRKVEEHSESQRRDAREALERIDVKSDIERREAREALEQVDMLSDGERRDTREALEQVDVRSDNERRDARVALEQVDAVSDSDRRDAREALELVDEGSDTERRDTREALEQVDEGSDAQRRDAREALEQVDEGSDTQRRDAREALEKVDVKSDSQRRDAREALEQVDEGSDTQRRDAREALEKVDVKSDTQRRDAREALEQVDVKSDTQRRDAREALEQVDVKSDTERRVALRRGSDREKAAALKKRERLQAQMHQVQRLETLGLLAGGIAHDFNNLLAVILNYASFISEAVAGDADAEWVSRRESVGSDLSQITLAAERAAGLTRQLLSFARREVVRPKVLDLNQVVTAIEEMLRRILGEQVELETTLADDLWPILADPGQLEQVLVNLAVNARDAMPGGGVLAIDTSNIIADAETTTKGTKVRQGRNVRLRVSDTGTGMAAEVAEHAFEPFFTTKDVDVGTGLGLSTVYGILAQADSQIQIYSEPGMGTTFSITFPVTAEVARPIPDAAQFQRPPQRETVIVVEDEQALRDVTNRILTRNGYEVITAANGPEALELARAYPGMIHLLVTDVVMPQMLGKEVAEKMREIKPEIEVLFMSGYARPVLASQGRLDPYVALVEKPFSEAELLAKAGEVLNSTSRGQSH
jgi:hypothetical protein